MQLYKGSTTEFITDAVQRRVAEKLGDAYYEFFRFRAAASEFNSWQNSLTALTSQLQFAKLLDNGIALELQLPLTSARLDVMLTGHDEAGLERAVIVELKQWSSVEKSEIDNCVLTYLGGKLREVPHPALQVANYRQYLADMNSVFSDETAPISLDACAWLHNLGESSYERLMEPRFSDVLRQAAIYGGRDAFEFQKFLTDRLSAGRGMTVLDKIDGGKFAPSKGLMKHAAGVIKGDPVYTLLDDQIVAYNLILGLARRGLRAKSPRAVVAVRGGPGTGKSVLALNVMAELLQESKNVQHATGSRAFTLSLRNRLGTRVRPLLQYFNSYASAEPGTIDVLIMDEAHRVRATSNNRFTPKAKKSDRAQIDELVEAARVSVFFVDDHQTVRPDEIGSSAVIREAAVRHGARYYETDLHTQFRCAGSDGFVDWLDQLLEIRKTGVQTLDADEPFDFRIAETPFELERLIRTKSDEGYSARLAAGFCWPWSEPRSDGTLVDDVRIGEFHRPWNAKPDAARLAKGIPKSDAWATDPAGLEQIGCIYTAQGFEFDYVGVIFGPDLVFDPTTQEWKGVPAASHDRMVRTRAGARFTDCIRNAYRVLLTRGMKGCYVHFMDGETEAHVRSRVGAGADTSK
jgi:hypothetical protein